MRVVSACSRRTKWQRYRCRRLYLRPHYCRVHCCTLITRNSKLALLQAPFTDPMVTIRALLTPYLHNSLTLMTVAELGLAVLLVFSTHRSLDCFRPLCIAVSLVSLHWISGTLRTPWMIARCADSVVPVNRRAVVAGITDTHPDPFVYPLVRRPVADGLWYDDVGIAEFDARLNHRVPRFEDSFVNVCVDGRHGGSLRRYAC